MEEATKPTSSPKEVLKNPTQGKPFAPSGIDDKDLQTPDTENKSNSLSSVHNASSNNQDASDENLDLFPETIDIEMSDDDVDQHTSSKDPPKFDPSSQTNFCRHFEQF